MLFKFLQIGAAVLVLTGTWFLAFGLRVRAGIEKGLKEELKLEEKGLISPSDVRQRPVLYWIGLGLITAGAVLELIVLVCT